MVSPYCEIDGVDFSALIKSEGVDISGGGAGVTEISTPYRNYADVRNSGRKMKKYTITTIPTSDRAAIETFLETVNNADEDAKFYPFDAERFGMIASAHASISSAMALDRQLYQARAEITCREPWLYGPSQGIDLETVCLTPQSVSITANNIRTPIRELRVSGDYPDSGGALDVSRGLGGVACYTIDSDYRTWYCVSSSIRFGTVQLSRISCGSSAIGLGTNGYVYVWAGSEWTLFAAATGISDISCCADGTIYAVKDGSLQKWNGTGWTNLSGAITRVSGVNSSVAICSTPGGIYKYDSGTWTLLCNDVVDDISALSSGDFVAILAGVLCYYDQGTTALVSIGGGNLSNVSINTWGPNWDVVGTNSLGQLWQYTAALGWTQLNYPSPSYPSNLSIRITPGSSTAEYDRYILLCEKMLRDDLLTMNWRGEIVHSWGADLTKSLAALAADVHGKISGGSISSGVLTLDNSDYLMVPFYGPLPLSGDPGAAWIEVVISAIAGDEATVQVAKETDLSDMAPIDHDTLVVGTNKIFIPELTGEDHVAIGLKAGASGSVSITDLSASVKRYVAASRVPYANPGEDFQIRVETSNTAAQLKLLQLDYNHRYYY